MDKKDVIEFFDTKAPLWDNDQIRNEEVISIILSKGGICEGKKHKSLLDKLNEINRNTIDEQKETENDEVERVSGYLAHCARAYCVSKYLHKNNVVPSPRLIDDLFLRLQKK